MFTMPAMTLAAFILGYIDIVSRFASLTRGGGWIVLKIAYLGIVIAANNRQKWARVVWSLWMAVGILASINIISRAVNNIPYFLFLSFCGVILPTLLLVFLWHPTTTDWFDRE